MVAMKRSGARQSKGAAAATDSSPQAKVAKVARTGNPVVDSIRTAQADFVNEFIANLVEDVSAGVDLMPVYSHYKKYKRELAENASAGFEDTWPQLSTVKGIDTTYLVNWLSKHSDLSVDQLLKVDDQPDGSELLLLLCAAVQIHLRTVLSPKLKTKAVMTIFLGQRSALFPERLAKFCAKGGLTSTGGLVHGLLLGYDVKYDTDGYVIALIYIQNGDKVDIARKYGLTHEHEVVEAWDDLNAAFSLPPMPSTKLSSFFLATKTGPWKFKRYVGKGYKDLATDVDALATQYGQKVSEAKNQGSVAEEAVVAKVAESQQSKHKEQMDKTRAAAKLKLAARKEKTAVKMK